MHVHRIATAVVVAASVAAAVPALALSGAGNAGKKAPLAGGPNGVNPSHGTVGGSPVFTLGGGAGINPSRGGGELPTYILGGGTGINPSSR
jgi:hypothetical protein